MTEVTLTCLIIAFGALVAMEPSKLLTPILLAAIAAAILSLGTQGT